MKVSEARQLKEPEEESLRLKRLVANQALEIQILREGELKKRLSPMHKELAVELAVGMGLSARK